MIPIETERLFIRNFHKEDWQDLYEYRSNPDVCLYQGYQPYSADRCKAFAETQSLSVFGEAGKWAQLAIELKHEGKMIADIGLKPESFDTRLLEFGITVSQRYQGHGYAAEAMTAMLDYLFNHQNTHRIVGITDQQNTACIQLLERLGFRKEGVTKKSFWNNNMWRDEFIYALLKEDFLQKK